MSSLSFQSTGSGYKVVFLEYLLTLQYVVICSRNLISCQGTNPTPPNPLLTMDKQQKKRLRRWSSIGRRNQAFFVEMMQTYKRVVDFPQSVIDQVMRNNGLFDSAARAAGVSPNTIHRFENHRWAD